MQCVMVYYIVIIYVNRSDSLVFFFFLSVSHLFYLVSLSYIRQWNTDYLRCMGFMLFAREHE